MCDVLLQGDWWSGGPLLLHGPNSRGGDQAVPRTHWPTSHATLLGTRPAPIQVWDEGSCCEYIMSDVQLLRPCSCTAEAYYFGLLPLHNVAIFPIC